MHCPSFSSTPSGVIRFPMPLGARGRITARKVPSQCLVLPQRYLVCCAALRRSGDIKPNWFSIMRNLETVFSLAERNLSTPQCWAYPDMLEARATGEWPSGRTVLHCWLSPVCRLATSR